MLGADGGPYLSPTAGTLGGHRRRKIYGRLDCRSALQWLARGQYAQNRVFFADEPTARAAGYRPCAVCLPAEYRQWMNTPVTGLAPAPRAGPVVGPHLAPPCV